MYDTIQQRTADIIKSYDERIERARAVRLIAAQARVVDALYRAPGREPDDRDGPYMERRRTTPMEHISSEYLHANNAFGMPIGDGCYWRRGGH